MGSSDTREILESLIRIVEEMGPNLSKDFDHTLIEKMAELYAWESEREVETQIGALLANAIAMARPLPPPVMLQPSDVICGVEVAKAIRDLDRGRGMPKNESGSLNSLEIVQRLGDYVAAVYPPFHGAMRHAIFVAKDEPTEIGRNVLRIVNTRWKTHLDVTTQRLAMAYGNTFLQIHRASKGGRAPRRPTSPAAILVAAVVAERPRLLGPRQSMRHMIEVLRDAPTDTWGNVTIERMAIAWNSKRPVVR